MFGLRPCFVLWLYYDNKFSRLQGVPLSIKLITARVRSTTAGYVFPGISLSVRTGWGGGHTLVPCFFPSPWSEVLCWRVPQPLVSCPFWGVPQSWLGGSQSQLGSTPARTELGYPSPARTGLGYPLAWTGYWPPDQDRTGVSPWGQDWGIPLGPGLGQPPAGARVLPQDWLHHGQYTSCGLCQEDFFIFWWLFRL